MGIECGSSIAVYAGSESWTKVLQVSNRESN